MALHCADKAQREGSDEALRWVVRKIVCGAVVWLLGAAEQLMAEV